MDELRGVLVGAVLPAPEASFFRHVSLGREEVNLNELAQVLRAYRAWLATEERTWNAKVGAAVGLRISERTRSLAREARIVLRGRQRDTVTIIVPVAPGAFYSALSKQRRILTNFLEDHALSLQAARGQQRTWLLPAARLRQFFALIKEVDGKIRTLNGLLAEWQVHALSRWSAEPFRSALERLDLLHRVYWRVWPVAVEMLTEVLPEEEAADVVRGIRAAVAESIAAILEPLLAKARQGGAPELRGKVERAAAKVARVLEELGMPELAREVPTLAAELAATRAEAAELRKRLAELTDRLATI